MAEQQSPENITIDGTEYVLSSLPEKAQTQVANLRATDLEIAHLQRLLAIAQTARAAYANALKAELPKQEH